MGKEASARSLAVLLVFVQRERELAAGRECRKQAIARAEAMRGKRGTTGQRAHALPAARLVSIACAPARWPLPTVCASEAV